MTFETAVSLSKTAGTVAIPGDVIGTIDESASESGNRTVVRLGSGVTYVGQCLVATKAGTIAKDPRRSKVWIAGNQKRYEPAVEDAVVAIVIDRHAEEYRLDIRGTDTAVLSTLAFEGATKRNKPALNIGSALYCRITSATKDMDIEASCVEPGSSRSWVSGETLYGELKGGNLVTVSIALARSLQDKNSRILAELGSRMRFELAVGANGRIWLMSDSVRNTIILCLLVGKADEMSFTDWQGHAKKVLNNFKLDSSGP
jgi:exosome complex component RRP40